MGNNTKFNFEWNDGAIEELEGAMSVGLDNATEDLREETYDKSRVDTGKTRESYKTAVEKEGEGVVVGHVGSEDMNSIYEEFGTGIYAENGDGRKDSWVYFNENDKKFYRTNGKKPNKPMRKALSNKRGDIEGHIVDALKDVF